MKAAHTQTSPTEAQQENFKKRFEEIINDNKKLRGNYSISFVRDGNSVRFKIDINLRGKKLMDLLSSKEFSEFLRLQRVWNELFC